MCVYGLYGIDITPGKQFYVTGRCNSRNILDSIEKNLASGDCISILIARSAHNQASSWPITLITDNLTITPLPGISDQQARDIQVSALNLASEVGLIGGFELLVYASDHKKLIGINWLAPKAKFWTQINSTSNYFEQNLRAMLDLPLGSTQMINQFTVGVELKLKIF